MIKVSISDWPRMPKFRIFFLTTYALTVLFEGVQAQGTMDSLTGFATLKDCIQYALEHQPALKQAYLDQRITEREIRSKLSEWYPQVGLDFSFAHYLELPTAIFPDFSNPSGPKKQIRLGVVQNSSIAFTLSQTLFNNDVLLASRSASDVRLQASQNLVYSQISAVTGVSKAYYDILVSERQLDILDEDIRRLQKSEQDAYAQYQAGLVDKTDYQRATITLNNSRAQRQSLGEQIPAKFALLKQTMGYPIHSILKLTYDTGTLEGQALLDTSQAPKYEDRIEYQMLLTRKRLDLDNIDYYKWAFLPSLSANLAYNLSYLNDKLSSLYQTAFPNSLFGLTVSLPLFQGFKRVQDLRTARLEMQRATWDLTAMRHQIYSEFTQAMASYKANLNQWVILKRNQELAKQVYETISLQYKAGIKTYLEVISAESDLRSSEFNYLNALFNLLVSKIDVEQAMGKINSQSTNP